MSETTASRDNLTDTQIEDLILARIQLMAWCAAEQAKHMKALKELAGQVKRRGKNRRKGK